MYYQSVSLNVWQKGRNPKKWQPVHVVVWSFMPGALLVLTNEIPCFVGFESKRGIFAPAESRNEALVMGKNNDICPKSPIYPEQGCVNTSRAPGQIIPPHNVKIGTINRVRHEI